MPFPRHQLAALKMGTILQTQSKESVKHAANHTKHFQQYYYTPLHVRLTLAVYRESSTIALGSLFCSQVLGPRHLLS